LLQIFYPQEQLEDEMEIDLIFAQIIADCRKPNAYRIRNFERDAVSQILRTNRIPPAALDFPQQVAVDVKLAVIQCARGWPLYFSVIFPVVEQILNKGADEVMMVQRLLAVHETGL
uniref:Phosphorylase b kinase regulatory subunit n=1 Tax=Gongylonema pulchrum TaxID=637853 RepID=A0A183DKG5_9BILA